MTLPYSGNLSIKDAAGLTASIQQEILGNVSSSQSLIGLGTRAGKSAPVDISDFYGYDHTIPFACYRYTEFTETTKTIINTRTGTNVDDGHRNPSLHGSSASIFSVYATTPHWFGDTGTTSIQMRYNGGSWTTYSISTTLYTTVLGQYFKFNRQHNTSGYNVYYITPNNGATPYGTHTFEFKGSTDSENIAFVSFFSI